jgi:uncharacterized protein (TIGR03437 family)
MNSYVAKSRVLLFLGLCLEGGLVAQTLEPRAVRAPAGEARTATWRGAQMTAITSTRTTPALEFPIRVELTPEGGLRFFSVPTTPPGEYTVEVTGHDAAGRTLSDKLQVTVDALRLDPAAVTGRPLVILVNGYQFFPCQDNTSSLAASMNDFGYLATNLHNADGADLYFFNTCSYDLNGKIPIEQLAAELGKVIAMQHALGYAQFDLVTHSMGGLIVRAYLAGLQTDGSLAPPANPLVRKFVEIATPNFGSFLAATDPFHDTQTQEMTPGSSLLWTLSTWNQRHDDLRGVDALAIIGNLGYAPLAGFPPAGASDGVVTLTSASLGFARDPSRTLILPYCHIGLSGTHLLPFLPDCDGPGIATAAETFQIVSSFLAGTSAWQSVANTHTPPQDYWLSRYGGIFFGLQTAGGQWIGLSSVGFGTAALNNGGASGAVFYNEFLKGTDTFSVNNGAYTCGPFTQPLGFYYSLRCKFSPQIWSVGPLVAGSSAVVVQQGQTITIAGAGFGAQQCSSCQVSIYPNIPLKVTSWSDQAITASLPLFTSAGVLGLTVQTGAGSDYTTFMTTQPAPAISAVVNGASGATGAIAPGEIVTIAGSGLGPNAGVSFSVNPNTGKVDTTLAGTTVLFNGFAAPITYTSANQINAIVPYEIAGQASVTIQVQYQGAQSAGVVLTVGSAAPGVFTFNATGKGQAVAANQNGTLNGPSSPAAKGSYETIYFTGGGQTSPPGVTGSVNGSTLKWLAQNIRVTVGGVPAGVEFDGAAPGFVDGVGQLNIQIANNTPSGSALPLVLNVAGNNSPSAATLAIQ